MFRHWSQRFPLQMKGLKIKICLQSIESSNKVAELAVLFSRQIENSSHNFNCFDFHGIKSFIKAESFPIVSLCWMECFIHFSRGPSLVYAPSKFRLLFSPLHMIYLLDVTRILPSFSTAPIESFNWVEF